MERYSASEQDTEALGRALVQRLQPGAVVAFTGDLGAGKTAFVRGMAQGLGIPQRVTSPTFTIVNEYEGGRLPLFHFDMYRLRDADDLFDIGWEDFLRRGGRCRRVLTMPGKSSYQAMRYSGAYQLARAREELRQAELELPEAFAAWPGELVELNLAKGTGRGLWRVRESVCGLTAAGTYTRLTLGEP